MAIATTGGSGVYTKLGGSGTVNMFTTPNISNAIFIIDIVETIASPSDETQASATIYTRRAGPNKEVFVSDKPTGAVVSYTWVSMVIT